VHGSDICWKKFVHAGRFYDADVLVLGGDMTGKAVVPIVHQGGEEYRVVLLEQESILHGEAELRDMVERIRSRGYYPHIARPEEIEELREDPERVDKLFRSEALHTVERWLEYGDEKLAGSGIRCYVAPGNDDIFEIDDVIRAAKHVKLAEGEVIPLDERHEMISSGWSNPTPWRTYREEEEDQLRGRYERMIAGLHDLPNSVFNFHVPPYNSTLDEAPELTDDLRPKFAGRCLVPVGSRAVRGVIEEYQPLLALHGHIHEAKGTARIGRTLCVNPGSMYEQGALLGALVRLGPNKIESHVLTTG
jgi:Icc-related predicted phosphoesterase